MGGVGGGRGVSVCWPERSPDSCIQQADRPEGEWVCSYACDKHEEDRPEREWVCSCACGKHESISHSIQGENDNLFLGQ